MRDRERLIHFQSFSLHSQMRDRERMVRELPLGSHTGRANMHVSAAGSLLVHPISSRDRTCKPWSVPRAEAGKRERSGSGRTERSPRAGPVRSRSLAISVHGHIESDAADAVAREEEGVLARVDVLRAVCTCDSEARDVDLDGDLRFRADAEVDALKGDERAAWHGVQLARDRTRGVAERMVDLRHAVDTQARGLRSGLGWI
jgi:hypothetical protein